MAWLRPATLPPATEIAGAIQGAYESVHLHAFRNGRAHSHFAHTAVQQIKRALPFCVLLDALGEISESASARLDVKVARSATTPAEWKPDACQSGRAGRARLAAATVKAGGWGYL